MPYALATNRRRRVALGVNATWSAWRLPGWDGEIALEALGRETRLRVIRGSVQVNSLPVRQSIRLQDRDLITCGEYQVRYENLF